MKSAWHPQTGWEYGAADWLCSRQMLVGGWVACAAVRFYLSWQYYCISSDGVHYIEAAQDYYAGRIWAGLDSVYPPGYPVLLAVAHAIGGDWERSGQMLSVLCGVLILWPLFLLFRDALGARVAVLACWLAAISPFMARYSAHVRSESPYLFFSTLALWVFYGAVEARSTRRFFLGGLIAGFAYLIRPEAVAFVVLLPGFLLLRRLLKIEPSSSAVAKASAALCGGFLLLALPYIVYLSIDTGRWGALTRKAGVTLSVSLSDSGLLDGLPESSAADKEAGDFVGFITSHPVLFIKKVALDTLPAIGTFFEVLHFSYVPFLLIGLVLVARERFWLRKDFLLLVFAAFFVFAFTLILVRRRYSLQAVPVSLGWCAVGMLWSWHYLRRAVSQRMAGVALGFLLLFFLGATVPKTLTPISREKSFVRESGLYLRHREPQHEQKKIAVLDDRVSFYARSKALMIDEVQEAALPDYLRRHGANYLAIEAKTWHKRFPAVARAPEGAGLYFEKEFVGTRKDRMLIFQVGQ